MLEQVSHVIPALLRRFHEALQREGNTFVTELLSKPRIFVVGTAHDL